MEPGTVEAEPAWITLSRPQAVRGVFGHQGPTASGALID